RGRALEVGRLARVLGESEAAGRLDGRADVAVRAARRDAGRTQRERRRLADVARREVDAVRVGEHEAGVASGRAVSRHAALEDGDGFAAPREGEGERGAGDPAADDAR